MTADIKGRAIDGRCIRKHITADITGLVFDRNTRFDMETSSFQNCQEKTGRKIEFLRHGFLCRWKRQSIGPMCRFVEIRNWGRTAKRADASSGASGITSYLPYAPYCRKGRAVPPEYRMHIGDGNSQYRLQGRGRKATGVE